MGFCSSNHECKKNPRQHPTVLVLTLPGAFLGGWLPSSLQTDVRGRLPSLRRAAVDVVFRALFGAYDFQANFSFSAREWKRNLRLWLLPPF